MPFFELFDETLDINSTENYELSLQASPEGVSFCILDSIRNKYVLLRSFEPEDNHNYSASQVDEILSKDDFLLRSYKKVHLIIPSRKFTLVPSQLYDPGKKDDYFTFNHLPDADNSILSNRVSDPDAFILFSASGPLLEVFNVKYPGVQVFHHLKPLLNHVAHCRKSVNNDFIHLHVEKDFFNLIIFRQNTLAFCNSFNYRNLNDILYYVLNTFKTLGIKQEETIRLSGQTEKYDDLNSAFSAYVRNLRFSEPSGNFTFSYVFNENVLHRYINLFSAVNCE